jgi:1-deoxy-D-xylulose-5-phosphate synthase
MRFVKPLDTKRLISVFSTYEHIITVEDGCAIGGFGSAILEFANAEGFKNPVKVLGIRDQFIPHGTIAELQVLAGIDRNAIKEYINKLAYENQ